MRLTLADLNSIRERAHGYQGAPSAPWYAALGQAATDMVSLVDEVQRLRTLLVRIYPCVEDVKGTEPLQAELERAHESEAFSSPGCLIERGGGRRKSVTGQTPARDARP